LKVCAPRIIVRLAPQLFLLEKLSYGPKPVSALKPLAAASAVVAMLGTRSRVLTNGRLTGMLETDFDSSPTLWLRMAP
jgi:hypothetical protein